MKNSMSRRDFFRGVGLIAGGIALSGGLGRLAGAASVLAPASIRVYSAEKGDYVMSETIVKSKEEWKKLLTPEQYHIMREKGTERAFSGKYASNHDHGIYRCAACGLDLYRSEDKFEIGYRLAELYETDRTGEHHYQTRQ